MTSMAISLRQPWALLMADGIKRIENRNWRTDRRGQVLIHASSWWRRGEVKEDYDAAERIMDEAGIGAMPYGISDMESVRGGIIGAFTITDCVAESDDPFFFGRYGFTVTRPIRFPMIIPCKGRLGFFEVPSDVAQACRPFLEKNA